MKNPARQKADIREDSRFGIFGDIASLMEDDENEGGVFALDIISGADGIVENNLSQYGFSIIKKPKNPEDFEPHYGKAVELAEYKKHHKSQPHRHH